MTRERPKSVTIISWVLIVMGGLSLIIGRFSLSASQELLSKSPIPLSLQYSLTYASILISLVCGIAMLKRQNWARFLYVGWNILGFIIGLATSPAKAMMIPGITLFAILSFFLFRPKANEYFNATPSEFKKTDPD